MFQFIQQNKKGEFIEEIKELYSEKNNMKNLFLILKKIGDTVIF